MGRNEAKVYNLGCGKQRNTHKTGIVFNFNKSYDDCKSSGRLLRKLPKEIYPLLPPIVFLSVFMNRIMYPPTLKDVHVLIPRTCELITFPGKRTLLM